MRNDGPSRTGARTTVEAVVRAALVLLLPLLIAVLVLALEAGGLAYALVPPAALGLAGLARAARLISWQQWLSAGATAGCAVAAFAFLALGLLPHLGLYRPVTVLSGSMRPAFSPGDLIVVTPEPLRDVRVGHVITYQTPVGDRHVQTHRVVKVVRGGDRPIVVTKGDSNNTVDPWEAELSGTTAWRYRVRIPAAGSAILALRSPWFRDLTVFGIPALLAAFGLAAIWRTPTAAPVEAEVGA